MRSLERRFRIEQDKSPLFSSLVNFGRAVEYQRFDRLTIAKWFKKLVDKEDYESKDLEDILTHMLAKSHSEKVVYDPDNTA